MMSTSRPSKPPQDGATQTHWSTTVPHTARSDRGLIHRSYNPSLHPELGISGCQTLYEAFRRGALLNPLGPCLGFRAMSTSGLSTPYIYASYSEIRARVDAIAAGLEVLELVEPPPDNEKLKMLGIYLPNCVEWILAEHAIFTLGGATIPFYDTLGQETVQFILKHTGMRSLVTTRRLLDKVCEAVSHCPTFHTIILVDGVTEEARHTADKAGIQVTSLARVEAIGAERIVTRSHQHSPPSPGDVATFCYTSGTTGDPKGALLTHANMISAAAGMQQMHNETIKINMIDRHLSYLPLAHIFERIVACQVLLAGGSIAFYRNDPLLLVEDWQACRPTILIAAPRVLNKIYDKILNGVTTTGGFKQKIFEAAVHAKTRVLREQGKLTHCLYDRLVFNKAKQELGLDHVRILISGSAPIGDNVISFFRIMLGIPVIEGYGQTEGCAGATLGHPNDMTTVGHVGGPIGCVEIALYDVPEMGYTHYDTSHRGLPCRGRGEICIRGPNVFRGYYKDASQTQESIDGEGWLHSGDIGLWRPDGTLQIIDRKKNIFKLAQGEYVAPEKIENILTRSKLIAQCFVYGDSLQSYLVAIVVLDEEAVRTWARSRNETSGQSLVSLCQSSALKDLIKSDIARLSKESKLQGFEVVKAVHLESTPFSIDNDTMTPTFKLKRQKIRDLNQVVIQKLYDSLPQLSKL